MDMNNIDQLRHDLARERARATVMLFGGLLLGAVLGVLATLAAVLP